MNKHHIYRTCPNCGANLDPGESCDCFDERARKPKIKPATIRRAKTNNYKGARK